MIQQGQEEAFASGGETPVDFSFDPGLVNPEEEKEKLTVSSIKVTAQGKLTMRMNRTILPLPLRITTAGVTDDDETEPERAL